MIALGCLIAVGCAVQGPDYEHATAAPGKAVVYAYRTYPTAAFGVVVDAIINCGDNAISLGPGGYHRFNVDPGEVLCTSSTENTAQVRINAEPGHEYYVRQWFSVGWIRPHVFLELVDADHALPDIQQCKRE
jgi:hypothetical protein